MPRRIAKREDRKRGEWLLLILLLPGLLAALALGAARYDLETGSCTVELTLDYGEIESLSVASGTPVPELLGRLKDAGVTGIAISEDLLGDLAATGQVTYLQRSSAAGPLTVIRIPDRKLAERVLRALSVRLSPGMVSPDLSRVDSGELPVPDAFVVRAAPLTLNLIGLGLPPDAVRLVKRTGLDPVARLQNHPALTEEAVDAAVSDMKRNGIARLISTAEEVFGFRGLIPYTARRIRSEGLIYGSIEFAKQKGDMQMCRELDSTFVRVHSIPTAEMAGMTPTAAVERFARAVKERNVRMCYVRLPETSGEQPIESGLSFVSAIRDDVERAGYRMGPAQPFGTAHRPQLLLALMALSIAAGAVLLLRSLISLSPAAEYGLLAVGFLAAAGLALIGEIGRQLLALSAALVFPTLGLSALIGPYFARETDDKNAAVKAVGLFLGTSACSLFGALLVVGLLNDRTYMVKADQFTGIKAAHLLPMLAVIFIMAAGLPILGKPFPEARREIAANLRRVTAHPLFIWHALAAIAALGIIGIALLRTGNDPGVGVTGIELKIRAVLDQFMAVRPRTKEFLIGHPALFLGMALLLTRRRAWGLPLVALGTLGQVSLLNTFCHIHTPLSISIIRSANGLMLGLLFGFAAWYLFARPRGLPNKPA